MSEEAETYLSRETEKFTPAFNAAGREPVWRDYLRKIALGDPMALASLYDETHAIIYSVASNILGNFADAEEVALDAYAYIWRSSSFYDAGRGTVLTWLIMLARSRAMDRRRVLVSNGVARAQSGNVAAEGGPFASAIHQDTRVMLEGALARLSSEERQLIELAFYSGMSHQELARHLQAPLGTVKSRIRGALGRLRHIISGGPAHA